jgi:hypothetical protein
VIFRVAASSGSRRLRKSRMSGNLSRPFSRRPAPYPLIETPVPVAHRDARAPDHRRLRRRQAQRLFEVSMPRGMRW